MNPASLPPSHPQPAFPNPAPQACSSTGHTLEQSTESLKASGGGGTENMGSRSDNVWGVALGAG